MKNPEVAFVFHHAKIENQRAVQLSIQCTNVIIIHCLFV
jgi:hypothetical protein